MNIDMTAVLGRMALGFMLSGALACGGTTLQGPEEEGTAFEERSAPEPSALAEDSAAPEPFEELANDCSGAQGKGTYKGYMCPSHNFITTKNISCAEARSNCALNANSNPGQSVFCTWNDRVIYRRDVSAGACNSLVCNAVTGTGQYKGYVCPSHNFITTNTISCREAQSNCQLNANSNPSSSFYCTWKGTEIFRRETTAGICPR